MKELLMSGRLAARESLNAAFSACSRWAVNPQSQNASPNTSSLTKSDAETSIALLPLDHSLYLREPLATTVSLLKKNRAFLGKVEQTRNSHRPTNWLRRYISAIDITNLAQLHSLHRNDQRSRILASFHFGDFLYGLNKLIATHATQIESKVLSQSRYTPAFQDNMIRGFGSAAPTPESQLLYDEVQAHALAGFLRRQSTSLLMFADLPTIYGESARVRFLGRWAWFPKSIAVLSLVNAAPILPVICFSVGQKSYVEIGKQIEPLRRQGESSDDAIGRITQLIVEFFEYFFRQHQHQWRYLTALPSYFVEPNTETAIE